MPKEVGWKSNVIIDNGSDAGYNIGERKNQYHIFWRFIAMLLWVFRLIFFIIISAVLVVNLSLREISGEPGRATFYAVLWGGVGLLVVTLLLDIFTPRKSLAALAGVFFGLLVGIFISWALAPVLDMINDIYNMGLSEPAMISINVDLPAPF